MTEMLHSWALAPTAVGTCCLVVDRRRARAPELAASVLMLLAMLDSSQQTPLIAPVSWAALLLIAAMALAALRRVRSAPDDRAIRSDSSRAMSSGSSRAMPLHTTLGLILMAVLLLGMPRSGGGHGHVHGLSPGILIAGLAVACAVYVVASAVAAVSAKDWRDRAQFAAMGASALLMSIGAFV